MNMILNWHDRVYHHAELCVCVCVHACLEAPVVTLTAGLSLGEYCALVFAGVLSFEDGLKVVKARGESMAAAATLGELITPLELVRAYCLSGLIACQGLWLVRAYCLSGLIAGFWPACSHTVCHNNCKSSLQCIALLSSWRSAKGGMVF